MQRLARKKAQVRHGASCPPLRRGMGQFNYRPLNENRYCPKGKRESLTHSITSSARTNTDDGIVSPSALADFTLTARWKLTGCSTGRDAGGAPLMSLST